MTKRSATRAAHGVQRGVGRRRAARSERSARQTLFTRVRAVLAGALVLGVGGSLTLAAWTDTEYAAGQFASSTFGIEGSKDGTTYAEHPAGSPAGLIFTVNPAAMSPGTASYSLFKVRTTSGTNVPGTVVLGIPTVSGALGGYLTYGVKAIPAGSSCNASTFGASTSVVVAPGPLLTAGAGASQALAPAGASPVSYCFEMALPVGTSNEAQGTSATVTWTLTATSTS